VKDVEIQNHGIHWILVGSAGPDQLKQLCDANA